MTATQQTKGRLGRDRWNAIEDAVYKKAIEYRKLIVQELMADGTPPLTEPLSPYMQYLKLQAMALAGSPNYTREAAARLAELSARFGPPQPFQQPFGHSVANNPTQQERAAGYVQAAQKAGPIQIFPGGDV